MKVTDLKKCLSQMTNAEIIDLICKLNKNSKEVQSMLDVEFGGNGAEDKIVLECKEKIEKEILGKNLSLKNAKKVISDFKKVCRNKENYAELLLYYVECGMSLIEKYGDIYEAFYTSMENTFGSFVKEINKFPDDRYYQNVSDRIENIIKTAKDYSLDLIPYEWAAEIRWRPDDEEE